MRLGKKSEGTKQNNKPNKTPRHRQQYGDGQRERELWGGRRGERGIHDDGRRLDLG